LLLLLYLSVFFVFFFFFSSRRRHTRSKRDWSSDVCCSDLLWVFNEPKLKRPILGLNLSDNVENIQPKKIKDAVDMFRALFLAMMRAHDARYISKTKQHHIVFIPVKDVKTLDFSLSNTDKDKLIDLGKEATDTFLKTWPK